jgi:hypothetical protein
MKKFLVAFAAVAALGLAACNSPVSNDKDHGNGPSSQSDTKSGPTGPGQQK